MLKGLIEYLIYLLFRTGRGVFIQVEKVYQDMPFFGARWDFKGIETLLVCFPRHRPSGPVQAVMRNAGEKLTRSHPRPKTKQNKTKQNKTGGD